MYCPVVRFKPLNVSKGHAAYMFRVFITEDIIFITAAMITSYSTMWNISASIHQYVPIKIFQDTGVYRTPKLTYSHSIIELESKKIHLNGRCCFIFKRHMFRMFISTVQSEILWLFYISLRHCESHIFGIIVLFSEILTSWEPTIFVNKML
jgi:hypothetical protein